MSERLEVWDEFLLEDIDVEELDETTDYLLDRSPWLSLVLKLGAICNRVAKLFTIVAY